MVRNGKLVFLGLSAFTGMLAIWSSLAGCQGGTSSSTGDTTSAGGSGGTSSTSNTGGASTTSSASSMATTTTGSSMGTGGSAAVDATIPDITGDPASKNKVGINTTVKLTGVVAMSQKFLVSGPGTSGNCLWGVFVSAPGLTETQPYSGVIAITKNGNPGSIVGDAGKAFCPKLGTDPTGDSIPDDVKPGDVLNIIGETDAYVSKSCGMKPGETKIAGIQVSNVTNVTKTGTASVPAPHIMKAAEIPQLAAGGIPAVPTDPADPAAVAFHTMWGGVKVAVQNVQSEPQMVNGVASIVDGFGHMLVHDATIAAPVATDKLQVGDKLYYRAYLKKSNFCHSNPDYADPATTFTAIEGFHYLDFCTWGLSPNNKCADLSPPSPVATDCNSLSTSCP